VCVSVCVCLCKRDIQLDMHTLRCEVLCLSGSFSSILTEQGFEKVCASSITLKRFKQFDEQLRKWSLLVSVIILVQNMLVDF
jgi:hypothetical protein